MGGKAMTRRDFLFLLAGLLFSGTACLPDDWDVGLFGREPSYDPFYVAYLERVRNQALTFQVPAGEDDKAWIRAQDVLKSYHRKLGCSRTLTVSNGTTIESAPSKRDLVDYAGAAFLYQVRRVPLGEKTEYSVAYALPSRYNTIKAPRIARSMAHARIIALYIISGTIDPRAFNDDRLL